jgi:hypothetical protein
MEAKMQDHAATFLRQRYVEIWPKILDPWTGYLISARSAFDGDLDKMIVLAVIGLMSLQDSGLALRDPPVISYDDVSRPDATAANPRPINVESISHFTSIPRESVRRKVKELIARKWVARDARGYLTVLPAAAAELEPLSAQMFRLIGQICRAMREADNVQPHPNASISHSL